MSKLSGKKRWLSLLSVSILLVVAACLSFSFTSGNANEKPKVYIPSSNTVNSVNARLYDSMHLNKTGLSREAFQYAVTGYNKLLAEGKIQNDSVLSIVDFTLSSGKKRLFVINPKTGNMLFNTYVSHGRNSGNEVATSFSNEPNSFKSSLGFYITGNTYKGQHGYSLRLIGEEEGINDNALSRGIVMHSAWYVNEKLARTKGFIGRSQGCPAIPSTVYKSIIQKIKDGSCLFLYSADKLYTSSSKLIQPDTSGPKLIQPELS